MPTEPHPARPAPHPPQSAPPGHAALSRRSVLAGAGALAAGGVVGAALATQPWAGPPRGRGVGPAPGRGIAVLLTLYGGNDGLNTVVPASDPAYRAGRPDLGYRPSEVLPLAAGTGLNPRMPRLKARWDAGQLAVVLGVGYPNPSLSHFQSMDIWQTATSAGDGVGWLGRWLDSGAPDPLRAISLGAALPPALRGATRAATALTSATITLPGGPTTAAGFAACAQPGADRSPLGRSVAASASDLLRVRSSLASLLGSAAPLPATAAPPAAASGGGLLAGQLQTVAALINAGAPAQVYQVSLSSFDTHADEKANHERLLGQLDESVDGFLQAVGSGPRAQDVVVFTVSEFGRRLAQNASKGSDHGTAAPVLVAGHGVRGGRFFGEQPSLTALDPDGNLRHTVDFRSVYATVLERVIGVDPAHVLGASYPTLDFL